jgi:hypothetical protein
MAVLEKILKNTTGTDIFLEFPGVSVPANSQKTINVEEYKDFAAEEALNELIPLISSGDIVVNDGTLDLTTIEAIRFIEYPDRIDIQKDDVNVSRVNKAVNFENGAFDVVDEGNGKVTVTIPSNVGEIDDDRLISVECSPDTCGFKDASLLIDETLRFIKKGRV